jgi:hypothetical protein
MTSRMGNQGPHQMTDMPRHSLPRQLASIFMARLVFVSAIYFHVVAA